MVRNAVSQLPVLDGKKIIGTVTEECIVRNLANLSEKKVKNIMEPPLPIVSEDTSTDLVHGILEMNPGVLVIRQRQLVGIITRSDLLKTI
jgi:predicted transcriptional regulator